MNILQYAVIPEVTSSSRETLIFGSPSHTSSTAAARCLSSNAFFKASVSTTAPRDVLKRIAAAFHFANSIFIKEMICRIRSLACQRNMQRYNICIHQFIQRMKRIAASLPFKRWIIQKHSHAKRFRFMPYFASNITDTYNTDSLFMQRETINAFANSKRAAVIYSETELELLPGALTNAIPFFARYSSST